MELEADEEANAKEDYDQDNGQVSNTVLEHVRSCIIKALKENESDRIDYMKTIVDPNCFATTIENMFHVSFLVKKKELAVSIDRNELMWLVNVAIPNVPMKKRIRTDSRVGKSDKKGHVTSRHVTAEVIHVTAVFQWFKAKKFYSKNNKKNWKIEIQTF